jgi:hypothetical protein
LLLEAQLMSRVEREENEQEPRDNRRDAVDRTPGKAEGDERTVDEALRKNEETERS